MTTISPMSPIDDQAIYYAKNLATALDRYRLSTFVQGKKPNVHAGWSWIATHPQFHLGFYSNLVVTKLVKAHEFQYGYHYQSTDEANRFVAHFLLFDTPSPNAPAWKPLGMVQLSHLAQLSKLAVDPLDIVHKDEKRYKGMCYAAIRLDPHYLPAHQPTICVPGVKTDHGRQNMYFYAEHLLPLVQIAHPNENVVLYINSPASGQRHRLGLIGHNWRAVIDLLDSQSAYDVANNTARPYLNVTRIVAGKALKPHRRLDADSIFPRDMDLLALTCCPPSSPEVHEPDAMDYTYHETPKAPPPRTLPAPATEAPKPAVLKPPFSGAKRLSEMGNSEPFLHITQHMIDTGRIEAHQDHVMVVQPFRHDIGTHVRPVKTWSSIASSYLIRNLPSDAWVLPYTPPAPVCSLELLTKSPPSNPHGYETTEGLKRRLSRALF